MQMILQQDDRQEIGDQLSTFLADSYALYLKTQNYHWNVTGPQFQPLHALFEEHYTDLAAAVDEIAERIRSLGQHAPGSFSKFSKLTGLDDASEDASAMDMVSELVDDHEHVIASGRKIIEDAEDRGDVATADLLTARLRFHEKAAWMLRSHLE